MEVNLVYEGFKFMVLGMSVVFSFLVIMVYALKLQAKIITKYFPDPVSPSSTNQRKTPAKNKSQDEVVAAITAAVMHHRKA